MNSPENSIKPDDVARWMFDELNRKSYLSQQEAVFDIEEKFGEKFVYENELGNRAIAKDILAAFRKITGDSVVWQRGERCWRFREDTDLPGRQQE